MEVKVVVRGIVALAIGAAVGVGAAFAVQPAAPAGAEAPAADCPTRRAAAQQELEGLNSRIVASDRELFMARLRRAAELGRARPWPDEPPAPLAPDALREHLTEAVRDTPAELLELDCSGYPCVAALSWDHLPEDDGLIDAGDGRANMPGRLLAQLQGDGPYAGLPFLAEGRLHTDQDGVSVFGMAWYAPDDYTAAKNPVDPEQAQVEGTVLDQIQGRTFNAAERWSRQELP